MFLNTKSFYRQMIIWHELYHNIKLKEMDLSQW